MTNHGPIPLKDVPRHILINHPSRRAFKAGHSNVSNGRPKKAKEEKTE
jgi:hypothetical protein